MLKSPIKRDLWLLYKKKTNDFSFLSLNKSRMIQPKLIILKTKRKERLLKHAKIEPKLFMLI